MCEIYLFSCELSNVECNALILAAMGLGCCTFESIRIVRQTVSMICQNKCDSWMLVKTFPLSSGVEKHRFFVGI